MTEEPEVKNGISFSRSYWPKDATGIHTHTFTFDLNDMWETHEDAASVFVAEALIANPPDAELRLHGGFADIRVSLWGVGGDTVAMEVDMAALVRDAFAYDVIRGEDQAEDVRSMILALEKLEAVILQKKQRLQDLLDRAED